MIALAYHSMREQHLPSGGSDSFGYQNPIMMFTTFDSKFAISPGAIMYFMTAPVGMLGDAALEGISRADLLTAAFSVSLGTFSFLGSVALGAHHY